MGLPLEAVSRAQRVAIATWRQRVEWAAKTPDCEEAQKFARVVLGEAATEVWKLWGNIDFKLLPPAAMRALCESLAEMMYDPSRPPKVQFDPGGHIRVIANRHTPLTPSLRVDEFLLSCGVKREISAGWDDNVVVVQIK